MIVVAGGGGGGEMSGRPCLTLRLLFRRRLPPLRQRLGGLLALGVAAQVEIERRV
jgi:hypothetical protein